LCRKGEVWRWGKTGGADGFVWRVKLVGACSVFSDLKGEKGGLKGTSVVGVYEA